MYVECKSTCSFIHSHLHIWAPSIFKVISSNCSLRVFFSIFRLISFHPFFSSLKGSVQHYQRFASIAFTVYLLFKNHINQFVYAFMLVGCFRFCVMFIDYILLCMFILQNDWSWMIDWWKYVQVAHSHINPNNTCPIILLCKTVN